jgi:GTP-binding protein
VSALTAVEGELTAYNPALLRLPRIAAGNKIDLSHEEGLARLRALCASRGVRLVPVSALTGEGVPALVEEIATKLRAGQETSHDLAQSLGSR